MRKQPVSPEILQLRKNCNKLVMLVLGPKGATGDGVSSGSEKAKSPWNFRGTGGLSGHLWLRLPWYLSSGISFASKHITCGINGNGRRPRRWRGRSSLE